MESSATTPKLPFDDDIFALSLQLEEIETQHLVRKGKWSETSPPDTVVALLDFEKELVNAIQRIEDKKRAHSIAKAVEDDAAILQLLNNEEVQASRDRQIALTSQDDDTQNFDESSINKSIVADENTAWLSWSELDFNKDPEFSVAPDVESICESLTSSFVGPSVPYVQRQKLALDQLPNRMLECSVCIDKFYPHKAVRLECTDGHIYCKACLKHRFILSITDETLFPPKCCGNLIPISLVEDVMTPDESKRFYEAEEEYSTLNRVYCSRPSCGRFISPKFVVNDLAHCNDCDHETCIHCKREAHIGECPADEALQSFMAYASEQHWKRCFKCQAMVERLHGCNHMTCRCKAEFCYRCGVKWKTCHCNDWDADLLVQRAEEVVDREARHPLLALERRTLHNKEFAHGNIEKFARQILQTAQGFFSFILSSIAMNTSTAIPLLLFDDDIFALTLQLQEIETHDIFQKGKWCQDRPPDYVIALRGFQKELENAIQQIKDMKRAHSLAKAIDDDAEILQQLDNKELMASRDRRIALTSQDGDLQKIDNTGTTESNISSSLNFVDGPDLKGPEDSVVPNISDSLALNSAGPSIPYIQRQQNALDEIQNGILQCIVCLNNVYPHKAERLECNNRHVHCKTCLKQMFLLSITDESLFPPKCCGNPIPISLVEDLLTLDESKRFYEAKEEYSTLNRVYCFWPSCGRFISLKFVVNDRAHCSDCKHETCIHCKKEAHAGECPADKALQNFISYAEKRRWRRCFQCKAMVEREFGCYHMM
ncbi:hypothetical protein K3495_g10199 [Podosphaera aphanis]|nr:hypothetical protein K3495_g10199 [Podosphaera aphanis]